MPRRNYKVILYTHLSNSNGTGLVHLKNQCFVRIKFIRNIDQLHHISTGFIPPKFVCAHLVQESDYCVNAQVISWEDPRNCPVALASQIFRCWMMLCINCSLCLHIPYDYFK